MTQKRIHLWIGSNFFAENEYLKYFEIDHSTDGDFYNPSYNICGFCKDIGEVWYDEDFIGIIPRKEKNIPVPDLLADAAVDSSEYSTIIDKCLGLGMTEANALIWYQDEKLILSVPYQDSYNGLKYIGVFLED
jgi:hypothetical protein